MAHVYVRSGAGGAATGADWANAYLTLAAALAAKAAGDQFWVAGDHSETTAGAVALTSPGTAAAPCTIRCVSHAGTVPPVSADLLATAIVACTGANSITYTGYADCDGIDFRATSASNAGNHNICTGAAAAFWKFGSGTKLTIVGTSASSLIAIGTSTVSIPSRVDLNGVVMKFADVGQRLSLRNGRTNWKGGSIDAAGSSPTTLIAASQYGHVAVLEGVDLSHMGSGKTIVGAVAATTDVYLKDCKLGASVTIAATPSAPGAGVVYSTRSDSGATNYLNSKHSYYGTETVETTIVLTGGASDGTTPVSKKIVTTANAKWITPFSALPIAIWNDVTGSAITVTVQGIWGGGAVPNNDDIWMDVEYLGSASFPTGSFSVGTKADLLATGAALAAGAGTWGGSTTKFKFTSTFTPQMKGPIYLYIYAGAASSTFYVDPKPVLS